jgi:stage III sporulation protein AG
MRKHQQILTQITSLKNIGKEKIILLGLAGILLIASSYFENIGHDNTNEEQETSKELNSDYESYIKKNIKEMIENIDGISNVKVMVTFKSGSEKVLKEDTEDNKTKEGDTSKKKTTVIFNQSEGDSPYVIKEIYPQIEGVAIAASGENLQNKKGEIINMIAALFDIQVHKISVISNE